MIIGIDASRANDSHKTGVGWYAWHLIEEFKKLSNDQKSTSDVRFVLYSDKPLEGKLGELPNNWSSKVLRWPPKRLWTQVRLSWEMLAHKPDVLFIPAHVYPFIHPKRTFMAIHDIAAARFPDAYTRFERWYSLSSARRALRGLPGVFVPSAVVKQDLVDRYGSDHLQKIHVTHLGHNASVSHDDGVLERYGITKPFFVSVSRLEEKKNTKRIIQAFDRFNEQGARNKEQGTKGKEQYELVLIGRAGIGYAAVKNAFDQSPNRERIIFPVEKKGHVPMQDVYNIVSHATAFLYPSLYEGFGIPILESYACGTPVITSNVGSMPEVAGDAALCVDPLDVEAIVTAMEKIVSDTTLAQDLREKGVARAKQFSWQTCARQTLDILQTR